MLKYDILTELSEKLSDLGSTDISDIKNCLLLFFQDYDITDKQTQLVTYSTSTDNETIIQRFLVTKFSEGRTEKTIAYYKTVLKNFFNRVNKSYKDITPDDVTVYFAQRQMHDKVSQVTCDNERRTLNSFYTYLEGRELVEKSPMKAISQIKKDKIIKQPLSNEEVERIRVYLQDKVTTSDSKRSIKKYKRYLFIYELLLATGMRCNEMCCIEMSNIASDYGSIKVMGKGHKERVVYLNAKAKLLMAEYIKDNEPKKWLFEADNNKEKHIGNTNPELMCREIEKDTGIEIYPHKLRRTFATSLLRKGMPIDQIATLLGHANTAVTSLYAITDKDQARESYRKYM